MKVNCARGEYLSCDATQFNIAVHSVLMRNETFRVQLSLILRDYSAPVRISVL